MGVAGPKGKAKLGGKLKAIRVADHDLLGIISQPLLCSHQRRLCVRMMGKKTPHTQLQLPP